MNVREATPVDVPHILDMLRRYRDCAPLPFLHEADDAEHITKQLAEIMAGRGVCFVAQSDGVVGMLIAQIVPSLWSPKHLVMYELAYWVNPEARGSSAGYRLLKAYANYGQRLKMQKRVHAFFISKMTTSPDIKYDKFGFSKLEEMWVA